MWALFKDKFFAIIFQIYCILKPFLVHPWRLNKSMNRKFLIRVWIFFYFYFPQTVRYSKCWLSLFTWFSCPLSALDSVLYSQVLLCKPSVLRNLLQSFYCLVNCRQKPLWTLNLLELGSYLRATTTGQWQPISMIQFINLDSNKIKTTK